MTLRCRAVGWNVALLFCTAENKSWCFAQWYNMAVTYQCLLLVTGLLIILHLWGRRKKREKSKRISLSADAVWFRPFVQFISPLRLLWKVIFRCVLSVVPCHSCIHSLDIVVVVYGDEINPHLCRIALLLSLSSSFSHSAPALHCGPNQSNNRPRTQACAAFICKSCSCAEVVINLDSLLSAHTAH